MVDRIDDLSARSSGAGAGEGPTRTDSRLLNLEDFIGPQSTIRKIYEFSLLVAAVVAAYLLVVEGPLATGLSWALWFWFAIDYSIRVWRAPDRGAYVRSHRIELLAALPLDFFRPFRLLRVLRPLGLLMRATSGLRDVLGLHGVTLITAVGVAVVLCGGVLFSWIEPDVAPTVADGVWWSIVTTTTVGYGDLSPSTTSGRLVAAVLMVSGIGLLGAVTGEVAERLTRRAVNDAADHTGNPDLDHLIDRLGQWPSLERHERRRLAGLLRVMADEEPRSDVTDRSDTPQEDR